MVAAVARCELVLWDLLRGIGKSHIRQPVSLLIFSLSDCLKCRCLSHPPECIHYTEGSHAPGAILFRHVEIHTFEFLHSDFTYVVVKTHLATGTMGYWLRRPTTHVLD